MKIWFDSLLHIPFRCGSYVKDAERVSDCDGSDDCEAANSNYAVSYCYNAQAHFPYGYMDDAEKASCDGSDDCEDYECPSSHYNAPSPFPLGQKHASHLALHRFQLADTLHIQPLDALHWAICNPVDTGKIAVVDEEGLAFLENFRSPMTLQEFASMKDISISQLLSAILIFVDLCFICDLDCEPVAHSEKTGVSTLSVWLHITNACNLGCHYCYVSKSSEHMSQDVSQRSIDAVIRSALRHGYGRIHLKYAGGEAMLRFPQVLATHDYAQQQARKHNLQLSASLLSNGTIMTQRMIEQLKVRCIRVMISLDGIGTSHDQQRPYIDGRYGSFAMVERTISRLLASNLRPTINVVVSQRNIANLPALLSYILDRDLRFTLSYYRDNDCSSAPTELQFSDMQMIDGMRVAFASIEQCLPGRRIVNSLIDKGNMRAPHHYACGVGRNYLVINQRGEVAKCQMDMAQPVITILMDDPLAAINNEPSGIQAVDVDHKEGCRTCIWRYWCGGGCPLVTYRATGRNDLHSPNCAIYKAIYPEAVRLEALRLLTYGNPLVLLLEKSVAVL
jgi:uncharacterized protein